RCDLSHTSSPYSSPSPLSLSSSFSFYCSPPPPHLHSFPTRRSSDLTMSIRLPHRMRVAPVGPEASSFDGSTLRPPDGPPAAEYIDRKSTRLNSSHVSISYAVFCLKKKKK